MKASIKLNSRKTLILKQPVDSLKVFLSLSYKERLSEASSVIKKPGAYGINKVH